MTELIRATRGADRWETEVRDPAAAAIKDGRAITRTWDVDRWIHATYSVAPIPAGWASWYSATAGYSGVGVPATGPYPTRDAAEDAAITGLLRWVDDVVRRNEPDNRAAKRLQAAIRADIDQGALFDAPEVEA